MRGSDIRHSESSYLAGVERDVPKAFPHSQKFCQTREALGIGKLEMF